MHAGYLFVDEHFGTDPHAYDYELEGDEVIGRSRIARNGDEISNVHARKPHTVKLNVAVKEVPEQFVTVEMNRNATLAIQAIARRMVERIAIQQTQEANS